MTNGKHRRPGRPNLRSYPFLFTPKHCAGTSCMHTHADDARPPQGNFPQLRGGAA